jgi:2-oxoglutarate dehydrogenase E1 component
VRGTFSQRHAAYYDVETGRPYLPLQNLPMAKASFEIHNSPLSENAAVAFEHGYTMVASDRLVLWEAQYGDFINTAQAMIDEFVASARAKWGHLPALVLLLPHGNEGQGPDHSSARLERFLQLAAEDNLRITCPTTAAQYFHLLRRQAALLRTDPLPLIVMTPKGLLRHPRTASRRADLAEGRWLPVIDDEHVLAGDIEREAIRRLVLCTGRVYVDLVSGDLRGKRSDLAIARVEQLAPFPADELRELFGQYPLLESVTWLQEEPANMGAWEWLHPRLETLSGGRWPVNRVARPPSSSPAEGSAAVYGINQRRLVAQLAGEGSGNEVSAEVEARDASAVNPKDQATEEARHPLRVAQSD